MDAYAPVFFKYIYTYMHMCVYKCKGIPIDVKMHLRELAS